MNKDMLAKRSRVAAFVLASLVVLACAEWYTSPPTAGGVFTQQRIPRARVTVAGGTRVVLVDARVRPDTITGTDPGSRARVAIPTNKVVKLESEEYSQLRTLSLFAGVGLAFIAVNLYAIAHNR
ncbi:MAG: hypothetical protein ACJ785_01075 [Gemmatimonadaceae bacterium]